MLLQLGDRRVEAGTEVVGVPRVALEVLAQLRPLAQPLAQPDFAQDQLQGLDFRDGVAIVGAIMWFGLNGLLWYTRPSDLLWLLGSAVLGTIFFAAFFLHLQMSDFDRLD